MACLLIMPHYQSISHPPHTPQPHKGQWVESMSVSVTAAWQSDAFRKEERERKTSHDKWCICCVTRWRWKKNQPHVADTPVLKRVLADENAVQTLSSAPSGDTKSVFHVLQTSRYEGQVISMRAVTANPDNGIKPSAGSRSKSTRQSRVQPEWVKSHHAAIGLDKSRCADGGIAHTVTAA